MNRHCFAFKLFKYTLLSILVRVSGYSLGYHQVPSLLEKTIK